VGVALGYMNQQITVVLHGILLAMYARQNYVDILARKK
jgi:hypothetical protein